MFPITLSAVCLLVGTAASETPSDDRVAHWVFTEDQYEDGAFRPLEGDWSLALAEPTFVGEGNRQALLLPLSPQLMLAGEAVDPALLPARTCTIEAWIAMDTVPKWGGIFCSIEDNGSEETGLLLGSRDRNFAFAVASTGADDGDGTLTYLTASVPFQPGRWYHVVGTYDGKTQRIFVNGEAAGESLVQSGPLLYSERHTVAVAAYKDINEDYRLSGALHEVALYGKALRLPEIQRRYRKLKGKLPSPTNGTFNDLPESSAPPLSELQPAINTAIEQGVERLLLEQYRDGSWGYNLGSYRNGATSLAVYTLLKCGLPRDHPAVVRGLQFLRARRPTKVYSAGVELMALGATGNAEYAEWAQEIVDQLLEWESEVHPGSWGYPGGAADLSNSQFAALGFWGASELGLDVPKDVWERMLTKAVKDHQPFVTEVEWAGEAKGKRTGKRRVAGFTYFKDGVSWPETGTMTTAGLCVIGIPRMLLGKKLGVRAGRLAEQGTMLGMGWLEYHYSMDTNPVLGDNLYYYLYGMERVGAFFNTEYIGGHPWYRDGADVLVRKQKDNGHWGETESDTAFALLFLRRASAPRQSGPSVDRRASAYADTSGTVHLHATGSARMTMWIQGFQESLEEDFEGSDRLWRGLRVIEVQYLADGELVATVAGDPSRPWSGERYAARYAFPLPGEHTLSARVRIVSPIGDPEHPGEGGASEVDVIESVVMQVTTKSSPEDWMAANLEYAGEDLLQAGEPSASASSSSAETSGPNYAVDGVHSTRWVCAAEDSEPWIQVKLRRPVRASAILLSQANSKLSMRGQYAAVRRIALSINRGKPVEVDLGPDDLRQVRIELDRRTRVRELRVMVLQRAPAGASAGFSGIELR
ncbi:MAG: discoidin domain-containing protein [Planctomycetota bacterium]|jgi:hypothetical protein|nr:discoidin domain-containing protein [Planctomycetota bacterium]MDP6940080.1 discoidin domain-containing protein [Planctomycetota bacterium]